MSETVRFTHIIEPASRLMQEEMKKHRITGASIAVVDGDAVVWQTGFGYSDKEAFVVADENTIYKIGSITKVFTAVAVMRLAQHGRLHLDQPVVELIPDFQVKSRFPENKPITVRDLMTHHSGLPCDYRNGFFSPSADEAPQRFTVVLDYLRDAYMASPNGLVYAYSNIGAALLGIVVERASGMIYEQYITQEILQPLGMTQTGFGFGSSHPGLSKGYNEKSGEYEVQIRDLPAGGLFSTAADMTKFLRFVLGTSPEGANVLDKQWLDNMFVVQNENNPRDFGFKTGLNWILSWPSLEDAGGAAWHDGGTLHFLSMLAFLRRHGAGVVILTNASRGVYLNHRVADFVLKELVRGKSDAQPSAPSVQPTAAPQLEDISGVYASLLGPVEITRKGSRLQAKLGANRVLLRPQEEGWHGLSLLLPGGIALQLKALSNLRLKVLAVQGERILGMEQRVGENTFVQPIGREYVPIDPHTKWNQALGTYQAVQANNHLVEQLTLSYVKQRLVLRTSARKMGKITLLLQPVNDEEAVIQGLGRFAGETVFLQQEKGLWALRLSGLDFVIKQKK